jgi:hypothetical protein
MTISIEIWWLCRSIGLSECLSCIVWFSWWPWNRTTPAIGGMRLYFRGQWLGQLTWTVASRQFLTLSPSGRRRLFHCIILIGDCRCCSMMSCILWGLGWSSETYVFTGIQQDIDVHTFLLDFS